MSQMFGSRDLGTGVFSPLSAGIKTVSHVGPAALQAQGTQTRLRCRRFTQSYPVSSLLRPLRLCSAGWNIRKTPQILRLTCFGAGKSPGAAERGFPSFPLPPTSTGCSARLDPRLLSLLPRFLPAGKAMGTKACPRSALGSPTPRGSRTLSSGLLGFSNLANGPKALEAAGEGQGWTGGAWARAVPGARPPRGAGGRLAGCSGRWRGARGGGGVRRIPVQPPSGELQAVPGSRRLLPPANPASTLAFGRSRSSVSARGGRGAVGPCWSVSQLRPQG